MKLNKSYASESSIVAMGARLQKAMKESGEEYLMLNRGVNSVVNINLNEVIKYIDFNSNNLQVYPATSGKIELRKAINQEYFNSIALPDNILITGGGISGLDICFQTLNVEEIVLPRFFWGTYSQIATLRKVKVGNYHSYDHLYGTASKYKNKAVVICDPGNPLGEKYPDDKLLALIIELNKHDVVVMFDSPYRRLFYDRSDDFFQQLHLLENVIIIESFSKSLGLSGQRIGFLHSINSTFISEATLRLMYATNGVNAFAQMVVTQLLTTKFGIDAVSQFKQATQHDIKKNIEFLTTYKLIASELYESTAPLGIFAVLNVSPEKLFLHKVGSVGLDYFVQKPFNGIENYSRILVSYPHKKFVSFLQNLI